MKFILDFLFRLTHISYWYMINNYNKNLDDWVLKSMKTHKFTDIERYTAKLNGKDFWIENRPYGVSLNKSGIRPSCRTISKMLNHLDNEIFKD